MNIGFLKRIKPRPPRRQRYRAFMSVTPLEMRLAPAVLVSPFEVTYENESKQEVDVKISVGVFDATTINQVFTFNTGNVSGITNTSPQQLQELDLTQLAHPADAAGATLSITLNLTAPSSPLPFSVGFINAPGINLGAVSVQGDLGGINAGATTSGVGLASLTVGSMGQLGTTTQPPLSSFGLVSTIQGSLGGLSVNGNLNGELIDVLDGSIGPIALSGSLIGGSTLDSGAIIASGTIGPVTIGGNIVGSTGPYSGSITSGGDMGNVTVDGSIEGNTGANSGQIFSGGTIGAVQVGVATVKGSGNVIGSSSPGSGTILATGDFLSTVTVVGSLEGGTGNGSGEIGSAFYVDSSIVGPVNIGGNLVGSSGYFAGSLFSAADIGKVTVGGSLEGGLGNTSGAIAANGNLGQVTVNGNLGLVGAGLIFGKHPRRRHRDQRERGRVGRRRLGAIQRRDRHQRRPGPGDNRRQPQGGGGQALWRRGQLHEQRDWRGGGRQGLRLVGSRRHGG